MKYYYIVPIQYICILLLFPSCNKQENAEMHNEQNIEDWIGSYHGSATIKKKDYIVVYGDDGYPQGYESYFDSIYLDSLWVTISSTEDNIFTIETSSSIERLRIGEKEFTVNNSNEYARYQDVFELNINEYWKFTFNQENKMIAEYYYKDDYEAPIQSHHIIFEGNKIE